jgi:hypothetical protein
VVIGAIVVAGEHNARTWIWLKDLRPESPCCLYVGRQCKYKESHGRWFCGGCLAPGTGADYKYGQEAVVGLP